MSPVHTIRPPHRLAVLRSVYCVVLCAVVHAAGARVQPHRCAGVCVRAAAGPEGVKEVEIIADLIAAAPLDDGRECAGRHRV